MIYTRIIMGTKEYHTKPIPFFNYENYLYQFKREKFTLKNCTFSSIIFELYLSTSDLFTSFDSDPLSSQVFHYLLIF